MWIRIDKPIRFDDGSVAEFGKEFQAARQTRIDEQGNTQEQFLFRPPWLTGKAYFLTSERAHILRASSSDASGIAKRTYPSTAVLFMTDGAGTPLRLGTGFVVAPNIIATNLHVIEGAAGGEVKFIGKERRCPISFFLTKDPMHDLALVQINAPDVPPLLLAGDEPPDVGSAVFVIGNPQGFEGTFSTGNISRLEGDQYLQITAPISEGSSGGPVINSESKVIGVTVITVKSGQNLNFAVPVRFLRKLLHEESQPAK